MLESAEIDKKHQLKSLLLIDAAVKIVCHGKQVTFTPLTVNGEAAVAFAAQALQSSASIEMKNKTLIYGMFRGDVGSDNVLWHSSKLIFNDKHN